MLFKCSVFSLLIVVFFACSNPDKKHNIQLKYFSKNINQSRLFIYSSMDSLEIFPISDLKFKQSKRERSNEIELKTSNEKAQNIILLIEQDENLEKTEDYTKANFESYDLDSIHLKLILNYHKF
jgi:hypothetical protein